MNQTLKRMAKHLSSQNENEENYHDMENQEAKQFIFDQVRIARQNENMNRVWPY